MYFSLVSYEFILLKGRKKFVLQFDSMEFDGSTKTLILLFFNIKLVSPLLFFFFKYFSSILASININLLLRSAHNLSMMADKEYNIPCPHFISGEFINETKTHHIEC